MEAAQSRRRKTTIKTGIYTHQSSPSRRDRDHHRRAARIGPREASWVAAARRAFLCGKRKAKSEEGRPIVVGSITTVVVHDERRRPGLWPLCSWAGVSAMGKALRKRGSPWGPGCGEIRGGKGGKKRRKKKGRRGKAVEPLSISSRND